ncbi:MAG: tetratricopeptide repeat protein [Proteobacteria bacterium]|nr:tetratricopeptide repeat protein [Pseudomonadota bacterium]
MGFFDKLLGRDSAWFLKRADKCVEDNNFGDALHDVRKARELAQTDKEREAVDEKEAAVKKRIYTNAYEQAKKYLKSGQKDAAQNAIDRAARFVQNDEERDALNHLVDESHEQAEGEKIIEAQVDGEEHVDTLGADDKWNLYVRSLPFAKAQRFDELGDDFKKAWIALQEGNFDEAISGMKAVYDAHSEDPLVMCEYGRAYFGKGEFAEADKLLEKSDKAEASIDTKLLRVEVLWAMKRYEDAETVLQAAHDMDPDNIQVLARIAQHGLISKDYESGIAAVEALLDMIPQDISVQRLAGRLYLERGDEDKALECYETVNRLYWQVNPQTKKITFDQNSAAAAASIYFKRGERLERAVELLEAIRANSEGETHVAICEQLAAVYDKMGKKSKCDEVLSESLRFMDDLLDRVRGPERAMLQLQYSETCDRLGDHEKEKEMLGSARKFFAADAEKGQVIAEFYVDLIDKKLAGTPFPKSSEMQDRMIEFAKAKGLEVRARGASGAPAQKTQVVSQAAGEGVSGTSGQAMTEAQKEAARREVARAEDLIRRMAAAAGSASRSIMAKPEPETEEDADIEDVDVSEDADSGASEEVQERREEAPARKAEMSPDDILRRMAAMAGSASVSLVMSNGEDDSEE